MAAPTKFPPPVAHGPDDRPGRHESDAGSMVTSATHYRMALDFSSLDASEAVFNAALQDTFQTGAASAFGESRARRLHDAPVTVTMAIDGGSRTTPCGPSVSVLSSPPPPLPLPLPPGPLSPEPRGRFGALGPAVSPDLSTGLNANSRVPLPTGGGPATKPNGQGGKFVVNPPDLQEWRERLFNVDELIVLTNEQFETYFPHIDNVYSHRSTQRYKKKPFYSHYWDCRMKGRPPGTPKSDDPNKKKRKRSARERDLCDVKIKITEYLPGAAPFLGQDGERSPFEQQLQPSALEAPRAAQASASGGKFWTIQRVNGNGGNGGEGAASRHRHSLAKSDEIKKSSVQRYVSQQEKEARKAQIRGARSVRLGSEHVSVSDQQRMVMHRKATGQAAKTARKHSRECEMKLYAACFCPFSQRVWIAMEAKGISYQYCEIDPIKKPKTASLLEANPLGQVPAIRQGDWACAESSIILEYLEDASTSIPLYPSDPRLKANCRMWIDHINSRIVPAFFGLLRAADQAGRNEHIDHLQADLIKLILAADEMGPYFLGDGLCLVDIHVAPFALRLSRILQPYRGWTDAVPGTRWQRWLDAMEGNPHINATTSSKELYVGTMDLLAQSVPEP